MAELERRKHQEALRVPLGEDRATLKIILLLVMKVWKKNSAGKNGTT